MDTLLSIQQVSEQTTIPLRTLRRYVSLYRSHLSVARGPKNSLLFGGEAIRRLVKISLLTKEGRTKKDIHHLLRSEGANEVAIQPTAATAALLQNEKLDRLLLAMEAMQETNRELVERVGSLNRDNRQLHTQLVDLSHRVSRTQRHPRSRCLPPAYEESLPSPESHASWFRLLLYQLFAPHKLRVNPERSWA